MSGFFPESLQPQDLRNRINQALKKQLGQQCLLCMGTCGNCLCQECIDDLSTSASPCPVCGLPLHHMNSLCADCLQRPKPYWRTYTSFIYEGPVKYLIRQFKNAQNQGLGRWFAQYLHRDIDRQGTSQPQLLVPVPSRRRALLKRGYNPAHFLAEELSKLRGVPCANLVTMQHRGDAQKHLPRQQRLKNLDNALVCHHDLQGLAVAVVDDVITTCATATAMSNKLKACGASQVEIWALARTPSP